MAGTKAGGLKAKQAMYKLYGEDYYKNIGAKGGVKGTTGGFASNKKDSKGLTGRERARLAGAIGGKASKKGKVNV